ncbi:TPR repeat-containing protein YfgC precursor [Sedimentisphaera cyanobacteriorum]|uniref:TPR repeat-containing protein YfgC n=1 Tax=Sedimentisphaera cyanobacteriorum TaxID=1940790 RepID=A0A1Q2HNI2_9BACT|nr:M48 family metallopeptidase [Sedimentisphaera cyanobacteriorum]AQQ08786.1 TPR repeat-containing protein YfgC precursor [Sedimentisphaera cyanobacteriorum]
MSKFYKAVPIVLISFLIACSTVPISNRERLNFVSDAKINSVADQEYQQFIKENRSDINQNQQQLKLVRRVGFRIRDAVERYFIQNNQSISFDWEFNVIQNSQANAWAMPGGKVMVYSGIFDKTRNEEGLAVVVAHEIAHAAAKHGAERMSQQTLLNLGGYALSQSVAGENFMKAFSIGSHYGIMLPYSRKHEYEADHLGLIFMSMAGYDPAAAVDFWQRMSENSAAAPEFMSTHPCDKKRIQALKERMPEAKRYYRESIKSGRQ